MYSMNFRESWFLEKNFFLILPTLDKFLLGDGGSISKENLH